MSREINEKIQRILKGQRPRILDLFAGCGGLSLGFQRAGFEISAAIEIDPLAAESHAINFHHNTSQREFFAHSRARDITLTEPFDFIKELGYKGKAEAAIDVIVGGPPCQAFARVGRAKLREVAKHPRAFKQDERGNLYLRYLYYVRQLKPVALLMENVPDVINYGGHNIAEETCETLEELGYVCSYSLLNAVYYGVPEMRERMFLIAYHKQLGANVEFPRPSHWFNVPKGYNNSRQVALKTIKNDLFDQDPYFVLPPDSVKSLCKPAVTVQEALGDLPAIVEHLNGGLKRGTRNPRIAMPYINGVPKTDFPLLMRCWPGFETKETFTGHVIRSLPRDYQIFRKMNPGDQYPEAYQHALTIFEAKLEKLIKSGKRARMGTTAYETLKKSIVPPYDPGKFPNKWRKMEADAPARTLMAHLGKDGYSHIHYDSKQARTISVREAARLQSFPDGFVFAGSMNPAFRQIGNAVPPLMAYALARKMAAALRMEVQ